MRRFHFHAFWKNGDGFAISSYGANKSDAFKNILSAKKQGKFIHRKNDWFHVRYVTEEETYTKLRAKGFSQSQANVYAKHGHTSYIVKNGDVFIN